MWLLISGLVPKCIRYGAVPSHTCTIEAEAAPVPVLFLFVPVRRTAGSGSGRDKVDKELLASPS